MNYTQINKLNQRQFIKVLNKEGIEISDYFSSNTYKVFFRRETRSKSPVSYLRIYYPQDYDIHIGDIFTIKGENYIIYSQDGIESDIYYTSILVKCDVNYEVALQNLPCVLMSDTWTVARGTVSVVSGSIVLYTKTNAYSNAIQVNDGYYNFGNYYEVGNKFVNKGLTYIYLEQKVRPNDDYAISYSGQTNFDVDAGTYQMEFLVTNNNVAITPQPSLTYSSSDTSVATITNTGLLMMLGAGTTNITALDTEHGVSRTVEVTVNALPVSHTFDITHSGANPTVRNGSNKTLTLHSYEDGVEDTETYLVDKNLTWSVTCDDPELEGDINDYVNWTAQSDFNKIRLSIHDLDWGEWAIVVSAYADGVKVAELELTIIQ